MKFQNIVLVYASRDFSCGYLYKTHAEDAARQMRNGRVEKLESKNGRIRSVVLVRSAVIDPTLKPQSSMFSMVSKRAPHCTIEKNHQSPGAKRWKNRPDMAHGGLVGGTSKRLMFGPMPRRREEIVKIEPASHDNHHLGFVRHYNDGERIFTRVQ
jgi:hypothetical protein